MHTSEGDKQIAYRGRLVTFSLPSHWQEEVESPDGGAAYFDPSDESIALGLSTITAQAPHDLSATRLRYDLRQIDPHGKYEVSAHGQAIACYLPESFEEQGEQMELHVWKVVQIVPPRTLRIAVFAATIVPRLADRDRSTRVLEMIHQRVCTCVIASDAHEEPQTRGFLSRLFGKKS